VESLDRACPHDVAPITIRAGIMNETGFIKYYEMIEHNAEGFGDRLLADLELTIYGYYIGSPST